ncbi:zinc-dependent alcohol dehydrogenase family protein [Hyphococcus luteus]|uniref:alcohol dehydrogenase n=1 Tax=Hyphococcus luteus TaxID=2058213 RepID=A0A2S7K0H5_9PROT|nr:zinc-dependent alcohol dehydrogenase family protein [Marinicaulis flavus]PQA86010.1 alcohol dehydrogenase [Marinicaulis flavus]
MRAMVFEKPGAPLALRDMPAPDPGEGEIRICVRACAVCRTDLHIVDGDLTKPKLPLVPGHEIIGVVDALGPGVEGLAQGDRVGVPWLGYSCGKCRYCLKGQENLCAAAQFTGYTRDGGFADYTAADARYCFPIPDVYSDEEAAPLMCAGLIGYRSYRMTGEAKRLGLYGFGAAAHIIAQVAVHQKRDVYAFTKPGDEKGQAFARALGAVWAGGSDEAPPQRLDAAIIFAPVGALVPAALKAVDKGGAVICAGIHMSDIPSFPYADLWEERQIRSVANLTRQDGVEFLKVAPDAKVKTATHPYPLEKANEALDDLRAGRFEGAAVLMMDL